MLQLWEYEELLQTAEHLGRRWYAMTKLCETIFSQSELTAYIYFEHNYNTYRGTWSRPKVKENIPDQPQKHKPKHQEQEEQEEDD